MSSCDVIACNNAKYRLYTEATQCYPLVDNESVWEVSFYTREPVKIPYKGCYFLYQQHTESSVCWNWKR